MNHCTVLVIGCGNTLRGDDGVGSVVAAAVAARRWPHTHCLAVPQLTPELAALLAPARAVLFIDARLGPAPPAVAVELLHPADGAALPTHTGDARSLLALALALYGKVPPAWLFTVAGADFGLRETLSPAGRCHAREAQEHVERLIQSLTRGGGEPCMRSA